MKHFLRSQTGAVVTKQKLNFTFCSSHTSLGEKKKKKPPQDEMLEYLVNKRRKKTRTGSNQDFLLRCARDAVLMVCGAR